MFSVGLLYSCLDFLNLNLDAKITTHDFKQNFRSYKYTTSNKILELVFRCAWIKINSDGNMELTERGKCITDMDYKHALILQLEDLISTFDPPWGPLILKGRSEIRNFLPQDALQCFKESGLLGDINDDLIKFWDGLAFSYRGSLQKRLTEIGRMGEKLSFNFEKNRTNKSPMWQAIESNLAGYDLLSIISAENHKSLKIEVKTISTNIEYGSIHISKNEWQTAYSSIDYIFHLWHLGDETTPIIVSVKEMEKHIPINNCDGDWESVKIPYSSFL